MTIREVTSRVRASLKEVYRDSYLSNCHVYNLAYTAYLKILSRSRDSIYKLAIFKTISIDTEEVDLYEDTCVPLECISCKITLPDSVDLKEGLIYQYIASPDLSTKFKIENPIIYQKKINTRSSTKPAYREGNTIYFSECFPCIKISYLSKEGIPDEDNECSVMENVAPIPDDKITDVIGLIFQELSVFIQKPQDNAADKDN